MVPRCHTNMNGWINGLRSLGHEVVLLYVGEGATEHSVANQRIQVPLRSYYSAGSGDFARWAISATPQVRAFWSCLGRADLDAIVTRGLTKVSAVALLYGFVCGVKSTLYTQGPITRTPSALRWGINSVLLLLFGGRWFSPVLERANSMSATWRDERITFIPFAMGVSPAAGSRSWSSDGRVRLIAVGKFIRRKMHLEVLESFASMPGNWTIRFVGEAKNSESEEYVRELRSRAVAMNVIHRVTIEVNVPYQEMADRYQQSDVCVMMARDEPASIAQLEAMSHGLGVIVDRSNGTSSYVRHQHNGWLCGNFDGFADACHTLAGASSLPAIWGRNSLELVASEHSPERVAAVIATLVE